MNLEEKKEALDERESALLRRLERIEQLEKEIIEKEKTMKTKEKAKKQVLLRLAPNLWEDLVVWADEEYRSINGQIEFLLMECVRKRKNHKD